MPALTSDRNTNRRDGNVFEYPVKAATKIFGGSIVCIDTANNLAIPGKTGLGLKYAGVAQETADNSAGLDGAIRVRVFRGPESLSALPIWQPIWSCSAISARSATWSTTRRSPRPTARQPAAQQASCVMLTQAAFGLSCKPY
jgi:hypothetical protein